jgi:hypothetical protein
MPGLSNPSSANLASVVAVKQSNVQVSQGLDGYIFASGIQKPEHSNVLSELFPQFTLTALLDLLGRSEGIAAQVWSWNELDRSRKSCTISSGVSGLPTASLTLVTNIADTVPYWIVGDTFRTEAGIIGRVTAVGDAGGFQEITVSTQDGSTWATGEIANSEKIGHIANSFEEGSSAPNSRLFLPGERDNYLNTLRRTVVVTGEALNNRIYLTPDSWYFENENITMKEHQRDVENAIMWHQKSAAGATHKSGDGIFSAIDGNGSGGGTKTYFTGAITETGIQSHIKALKKVSASTEYTVLCGADFMSDVTNALRNYYLGGGVQFGVFSKNGVKAVGLGLQQYQFMGTTVNFVYYSAFDDTAALPFVSTATSTKRNLSNYSLWLNMGNDSKGKKLITLKHNELGGRQRKLVYANVNVMMYPRSSGGDVASGFDGFKKYLLSNIGSEVRCLAQHGVLAANG